MTMKYMWILGLWEDSFKKIESYAHVAVDSIIIRAAKKEFDLNISNKPWSKWGYEEYKEFQENLQKNTKNPLAWEQKNWIKYASGENNAN